MITKTIEIDGKKVTFGASAGLVRKYRIRFHRDIIRDIAEIQTALADAKKAGADGEKSSASALPPNALELFENVAYLMAAACDPSIPETPEEWLDGFGMFSIYYVLPQLLELWGLNTKVTSKPKKK